MTLALVAALGIWAACGPAEPAGADAGPPDGSVPCEDWRTCTCENAADCGHDGMVCVAGRCVYI